MLPPRELVSHRRGGGGVGGQCAELESEAYPCHVVFTELAASSGKLWAKGSDEAPGFRDQFERETTALFVLVFHSLVLIMWMFMALVNKRYRMTSLPLGNRELSEGF